MKKRVGTLFLLIFIFLFVFPIASAASAEQTNKISYYDKETGKTLVEDDFIIPLPKESIQITNGKAKATLGLNNKELNKEINNKIQTASLNGEEYDLQFSELIPWGVERVGAPYVWDKTTGKEIKVAILDTGIDANHSDLKVSGGVSFIGGNFSKDPVGHGTMVAGVLASKANGFGIIGVAPDVKIYSVQVMDADGGNLSSILNGINWSIKNNMDVISMSFGSDTNSQIFELALAEAYNAGIVLVAAAGNEGEIIYPAKYTSVIAAGNIDENDLVPFGASGPDLELAAPGTNVLTIFPNNTYVISSGTSFSAPHTAGVIALLLQKNNSLTPPQIRDKLHKDALDLGVSGKDNVYGYGLLQVNLNEKNNISEARILGIENRLKSLESWKLNVTASITSILNSISSLTTKANNHENRIKALENNSRIFNGSVPNYFKYLSSSDRKNIACGYAKDSHMGSFIDLGWNCTITYRQTSRGETASCRCKSIN